MSESYRIYEMNVLPHYAEVKGFEFGLNVTWLYSGVNNELFREQRIDMKDWLIEQFHNIGSYYFDLQFHERRAFVYFKRRSDMLLFKLRFG